MPVPTPLRSRRGVLAAVAVLVLLLAVTGWRVVAGRAHDAVLVGSLYGARCSDQRLVRMTSNVRVVVVPDMDCRLVVDVTRPGRLPVRLVELRYPDLGPGGATAAQVDGVRWGGRTYRPVPGAIDAIFRIDRVLPRSGFQQEAVAHLTYRDGNCQVSAGTAFARMPLVTLRAYGVRREVTPEFTTHLEIRTPRPAPSCDGPRTAPGEDDQDG